MNKIKIIGLILILTLLLTAAISESINVEEAPAYSWIQGSWVGDGFGGYSEELWSPPGLDGKVMGTYRHYNADSSLNFYEFFVLDEEGLYLKHFNPDMTGWEEKSDYLTFKMISFDDKTIELKGLKYEYLPPDSMNIYLKMKTKDGGVRTEVFHMKRK